MSSDSSFGGDSDDKLEGENTVSVVKYDKR